MVGGCLQSLRYVQSKIRDLIRELSGRGKRDSTPGTRTYFPTYVDSVDDKEKVRRNPSLLPRWCAGVSDLTHFLHLRPPPAGFPLNAPLARHHWPPCKSQTLETQIPASIQLWVFFSSYGRFLNGEKLTNKSVCIVETA